MQAKFLAILFAISAPLFISASPIPAPSAQVRRPGFIFPSQEPPDSEVIKFVNGVINRFPTSSRFLSVGVGADDGTDSAAPVVSTLEDNVVIGEANIVPVVTEKEETETEQTGNVLKLVDTASTAPDVVKDAFVPAGVNTGNTIEA